MRKKIFRSFALIASLVFLACIVLIMGVLYTHFLNVQVGQMQAQADLASQGITRSGAEFTEGLKPEGYRLTWIDATGKVLYDSAAEAGSMENHLQREEVQMALKEGEGESSRYSTTLLQRQLYVAKKAPDGTVIRIADSQRSILGLLLGMLQQILIVVVIAMALSLILAYRLTRRIVEPLNRINLEEPQKQAVYPELSPLLDRVHVQQEEIRMQAIKLRQKQQEFDASTENMEEGLLIVNEQRQIISMNRAASEILNTPRYVMGKPLSQLDLPPQIEEAFDKTISGQAAETEMNLDEKQFEIHASPVVSSDEVTAVVLFILDMSIRNKAEQMRREFTANVSHELKTPLQTISGSAELIAEGMVRPEDVGDFGRKIHREAKRLIALIDDIIGLSRLDEGAEDMSREEVDLFAAVQHAAAGLGPAAEEAGIRLTVSGESAMVMGDFTMIGSIASNLCENAIKYSRPQGEVHMHVAQEGQEVRLTVTDNGIGIPKEEQERIFERFYRVDKGRSKDVGGTGLGLSIVKHAVQLHGGRIELSSQPGEGTTVTVTLPAAKI